MELRNWILRFGCASEEFRVVVASLADWMTNSSPPWAAYCALMVCRLLALDKRPGVRPVGIGETLGRDLAKLVMRAAGGAGEDGVWKYPAVRRPRGRHRWGDPRCSTEEVGDGEGKERGNGGKGRHGG